MRCCPHVVRLLTIESWLAAFPPFSAPASYSPCPLVPPDPWSPGRKKEEGGTQEDVQLSKGCCIVPFELEVLTQRDSLQSNNCI